MADKRPRIHKIYPLNSYSCHVAAYPDGFKGSVIREKNICLQYAPTTLKAVKNPAQPNELMKGTMELKTNGTDIDTIGLRLTYPIAFSTALEILHGLASNNHIDDLKLLQAEIERLLTKIEQNT